MRPPASSRGGGGIILRLGATAFLSAFLLFQVQPLVAKAVLPWFGGSPGVWTTCMLFFQVLLLVGYALAAFVERQRPLTRLVLPLVLVSAAIFTLPLSPRSFLPASPSAQPLLELLRLLLFSVGLPYTLLATTGPLSQTFYARALPGQSPYRLYALSNIGSLLSLLTYPVLVEPWLRLATQERLWSLGFLAYGVLYALSLISDYRTAVQLAAPEHAEAAELAEPVAAPRLSQAALWVLLPMLSSLSLLAFTNHICQNVAVIPFLWVAPLGLYLLSFIIAFDHERYFRRGVFSVLTLALLVWSALHFELGVKGVRWAFVRELVQHLLTLFAICMLCHGELVRRKPHPRYLTTFYLMLALGGALGGLFVSVLAPRLFTSFFEHRIALFGGFVLASLVLLDVIRPWLRGRLRWLLVPLAGLSLAGLVGVIRATDGIERGKILAKARNFYGLLTVVARAEDDPEESDRCLYHGNITHGIQFQNGERRHEPVTYYGEETGLGRTLLYYKDRPNLRVGAIGLGTGTVAAYARPGHTYRFYEINPEVIRLSRTYFGYVNEAAGHVDIVLGDARLMLEREQAAPYDVLVLDAFSGDAIPVHLLTREAMDIYRQHLSPDGALAIHISNRYLDLGPVVRGLAEYAGLGLTWIETRSGENEHFGTDWMILTRNPELTKALAPKSNAATGRTLLWTDEYNDLFRILK